MSCGKVLSFTIILFVDNFIPLLTQKTDLLFICSYTLDQVPMQLCTYGQYGLTQLMRNIEYLLILTGCR